MNHAPPSDPPRPTAGPGLRFILWLNALVFGLEMALTPNPLAALVAVPAQVLTGLGASDPPLVWTGEVWRLLSALVVHGNVVHVLVNMLSIWALGLDVEPLVGRWKLLLAYAVTGLMGSLASLAVPTLGLRVGASGAAFGLAGVLVTHAFLTRGESGGQAYLRRLVGVVVANLVMAEVVNASSDTLQLDNRAHLGGLWGGMVLGLAILPVTSTVTHGLRRGVGLALLGGSLGVLAPMALRPADHPVYHASVGALMLKGGNVEGARRSADIALGLDAHHPAALLLQHRVCAAQKDASCAGAALEHLLSLEPMPPDFSAPSVNAVDLERILLGEGLAAMAEKDFTLAIPLLRRAAEISPASAMNLNAWAWALVCRGARSPAEARLALDAADRARRISGGSDPGITHTYAEALRQAGQQEDALEVLRGMMRASPSQRLMWRWMSGDTLNDAFFQREEARMVEGTRLPEPT